ncbi:MAG: peptidylprolyl isomerase [Myxococcota bacterium]
MPRTPPISAILGWTLLMPGFSACSLAEEGIPPGKLAVVGETVLGPEELSGVQSQLGSYAQLRFKGREGRGALLEALVAAELLAQEAIDQGLGDDPRVEFALLEEEAAVYLAAELERRVPRAEVAGDTAALQAWYDGHPDEFWRPEQRNIEGVVMPDSPSAEAALARLHAGEVTLAELGETIATPLQARDDHEHPGFHAIVFDPSVLSAGDLLPFPVVIARTIIVGRVQQIVAAKRRPFDDPQVQERLVQEVRAPLVAKAQAELMAELAERFPERAP